MELSPVQLSLIKRTKILIVDDLPENLQMLGNTLRDQGFQIAFATNGFQALTIALAKKPNLILLDMSMPDMDGLTVCKNLKHNLATKDIPVIFLTARTDAESIKRALSMGAADYVIKPFNPGALLEKIFMHLNIDKTIDFNSEEEKNIILSKTALLLEKEYLPKCNEIKTGMFIDDVLQFAQSLIDLGTQNKVKDISEYGEILYQTAEGLKIVKMAEVLEQFPVLIKKIGAKK